MRLFTVLFVLFLSVILFSCEEQEENEPPVADFIISPATGPFTQSFNFNASSSYDPNEPSSNLQVRWDFDGDGSYDTDYSNTKTAEYTYEGAGDYTVVLQVLNSEGWTDNEEKTLIVYADSVPPVPSFIIEPDSSSVQTIFLFNSGGSTDQYTPAGELRFRWDFDGNGVWDINEYITDSTVYYKYDVPGVYRAVLEVTNNVSVSDTTSRIVYVHEP